MNRFVTASLALLGIVTLVGCGESGLGTTDLGGPDLSSIVADDMLPPDLSAPRDMTYVVRQDGGPVQCGAMTCGGTNKCCIDTRMDGGGPSAYCAATCNQGSVTVACRGPSQCAGNPCCVTLQGQSLGAISCGTALTSCPPDFNLQTFAGTTRLCEFDADCTAGAPSTMLNKCCQIMAQGQMQKICLSATLASFAGATCN